MRGHVAHIWRHPIKSHGREALNEVHLTQAETMPWDRTWAVIHDAAKTDGHEWAPCANFSRVAKAAKLQAISAELDEDREVITLRHPELDDIRFCPNDETDAFLQWVAPLMQTDRAQSAGIIRVPGRGMTDSDYPSISLNNIASNRAVETALSTPLALERWRGNIWLDSLEPWVEFDWIGKTIRIGDCEMEVRERITRCLATTTNPDTGTRDADTLGALKDIWGHTDFGVYAQVTKTGGIKVGDTIEVLV
jgi:uncharacterized protein YcbX